MANAKAKSKTKPKSRKRAPVKDLKAKDVRNVKGGDFNFTKVSDKSSTNLY